MRVSYFPSPENDWIEWSGAQFHQIVVLSASGVEVIRSQSSKSNMNVAIFHVTSSFMSYDGGGKVCMAKEMQEQYMVFGRHPLSRATYFFFPVSSSYIHLSS